MSSLIFIEAVFTLYFSLGTALRSTSEPTKGYHLQIIERLLRDQLHRFLAETVERLLRLQLHRLLAGIICL